MRPLSELEAVIQGGGSVSIAGQIVTSLELLRELYSQAESEPEAVTETPSAPSAELDQIAADLAAKTAELDQIKTAADALKDRNDLLADAIDVVLGTSATTLERFSEDALSKLAEVKGIQPGATKADTVAALKATLPTP